MSFIFVNGHFYAKFAKQAGDPQRHWHAEGRGVCFAGGGDGDGDGDGVWIFLRSI